MTFTDVCDVLSKDSRFEWHLSDDVIHGDGILRAYTPIASPLTTNPVSQCFCPITAALYAKTGKIYGELATTDAAQLLDLTEAQRLHIVSLADNTQFYRAAHETDGRHLLAATLQRDTADG